MRCRLLFLSLATWAAVTAAARAEEPVKGPAPAANANQASGFGQTVVPGEVIVRYRSGTSGPQRSAARSSAGAAFERPMLLPRAEVVEVPAGDEKAAAAELADDPNVEFAEPNGIVHATATPNDTRFASLFGLNNTGQLIKGTAGTADADVDAREGWNIGQNLVTPLRVAVIDSGIAANHPDLTANVFVNPGESGGGKEANGIDDDANGRIDDFRGWDFINNDNNPADDNEHGSHVAGTIAARANNALGVAGVASFPAPGQWGGPKLVAIKVLNAAGSGTFAAITDGFEYANTIGAKVANASLGGDGTSAALDAAISTNPTTLYVVAAGNNGRNVDTQPSTPCTAASAPDPANKVCVAATDKNDALASFSNFGAANVDLSAPGVDILSTVPTTALLGDDFEVPLAGRWTNADAGQAGTPRWDRTGLFFRSAGNSVTDSPGGTAAAPAQYQNNANAWLRTTTALDFTGGTSCRLTGRAKFDTEPGFDVFRIEASTSATTGYVSAFTFSGAGEGNVHAGLSAFDGQPSVFIRLRMSSDGSVTDDGAYLDDVRVSCFKAGFDATSYDFFEGTSMASPHVAGAAAFVAAKFPALSTLAVKDKLLRTTDKKAALAGKTVTGGRLNLYKSASASSAVVSGGVLRFNAGVGQTNGVTITRFTDTDAVAKYQIADPWVTSPSQGGSRVSPGTGCARVNDNAVKCPVAGITRIEANLNNLDDKVTASSITIPLTLHGGSGDDDLIGGTAGDTLIGSLGADEFVGNAGNDTIQARNDDVDAGFLCGENAGDTDTVNADSTPNDVITSNPVNCEVVNKG